MVQLNEALLAKAAGVRDAAAGRRRGRLRRAVTELAALLRVTGTVAAQARQRPAGTMSAGASGRVSLHDDDTRPIARGRLGTRPGRSPPTSATARRPSTMACTNSGSAGW